jgi:3-oxoacyl-[acyl-carrier protein] reductase
MAEHRTKAGRRVLVTGASRGIGRATMRRLAADGYRVIGLARKQPADLMSHEEFVCCDLSDLAAVRQAVAQLTADEPIYGLVNNAAMSPVTSLQDVSVQDMIDAERVSVLAPLVLAQGVVPGMRAASSGRIVNISSRAALGKVNRTAYGGAKSQDVGAGAGGGRHHRQRRLARSGRHRDLPGRESARASADRGAA